MEKSEAIQMWIDALRSGKYSQGREYLWKADDAGKKCYCALGVLLQIVAPENLRLQPFSYNPKFSNSATISLKFKIDMGLNWLPDPSDEINDFADHIINMNDAQEKTFDEIADHIEANREQILS
jgi:hypothetical protein